MTFATTVYNTIFKRNSVFVGTVFATAFFYDIVFNKAIDSWYDKHNAGKQWKDIRHRYVTSEEDDE